MSAYEPEPGVLGDGWMKLCCAALLAALARSLLSAPRGGYALTLALAFGALTFAGKARTPAYAAYVAPFLVSGVWALAESTRRVSSVLEPRRVWMGALVLGLAAALGLGGMSGLLQVRAWAQGRSRTTSYAVQAGVGFSERMDLGALDGLLDSKRRMLRIRGPRVDYLRGIVFDSYEAGRWVTSSAVPESAQARFDGGSPTSDGGTAALTVDIESIDQRLVRAFIPLGAGQLQTTPSAVLVDDLGVVRAETKAPIERVRFVPGSRTRAIVAAPRASDLRVPRRLRSRIGALAREWTEAAATDEAKLRAIETHLLNEFSYARSFERAPLTDPLVDFLFVHKRGHCEYFASALALLGRALGVPTRLVMGYRVTERSPFGYFVVRERNAHAWVEAWLPEAGWVTRDATPAQAQPQNGEREASYHESILDALGVGYSELTHWLGQRTLEQTGLAWLFGCAVLAAIVARGARRRSRAGALAEDEALLAFMQPLIDLLDKAGHSRRPDEPLERLAARLPDAESAELLRRYSALRYGGVGDRELLARDVTTSVATLRRRRRAALPAG